MKSTETAIIYELARVLIRVTNDEPRGSTRAIAAESNSLLTSEILKAAEDEKPVPVLIQWLADEVRSSAENSCPKYANDIASRLCKFKLALTTAPTRKSLTRALESVHRSVISTESTPLECITATCLYGSCSEILAHDPITAGRIAFHSVCAGLTLRAKSIVKLTAGRHNEFRSGFFGAMFECKSDARATEAVYWFHNTLQYGGASTLVSDPTGNVSDAKIVAWSCVEMMDATFAELDRLGYTQARDVARDSLKIMAKVGCTRNASRLAKVVFATDKPDSRNAYDVLSTAAKRDCPGIARDVMSMFGRIECCRPMAQAISMAIGRGSIRFLEAMEEYGIASRTCEQFRTLESAVYHFKDENGIANGANWVLSKRTRDAEILLRSQVQSLIAKLLERSAITAIGLILPRVGDMGTVFEVTILTEMDRQECAVELAKLVGVHHTDTILYLSPNASARIMDAAVDSLKRDASIGGVTDKLNLDGSVEILSNRLRHCESMNSTQPPCDRICDCANMEHVISKLLEIVSTLGFLPHPPSRGKM